jgi:hypothetical protein
MTSGPVTFRRGFKKWCETIAIQKRKQLNLTATAPLPPDRLAKELRVFVRRVEDIPDLAAETRRRLLVEDPTVWSAITIAAQGRHLVLLNSSHSQARQHSSLTHELAHLIIGHPPVLGLVTDDGYLMLNCYDKDKEDEANWLAGALLLPREALMLVCKNGWEEASASDYYGTSLDMLRFRLNVTGVKLQMTRARRYATRTK